MALFDRLKRKTPNVVINESAMVDLRNEIDRLNNERTEVSTSADLTPDSVGGKKRRYHYKDVNIIVFWQYGGQYGKTCKSIGMKRGDSVELVTPHSQTDDPEDIAICWKGVDIGIMKNNRLRGMVHQWKSAGLPVLAIVSQVGGDHKLFLEFAFYGSPTKANK